MARRSTVYVHPRDWTTTLSKFERKSKKDQKEFQEKKRYELSVQDLRDATVGEVIARYGRSQDGLALCQANGGCHPATFKAWDESKVYQPHMSTLRRTLRACGKDLGIVDFIVG